MNIKIKCGVALLMLLLGGFIMVRKYITIYTIGGNQNKTTFVVGTAAGYAPFMSINEHGEYEGFDIDIAHAVAAKMGKVLEIKDLGSMTSLFMALDQGIIDAIIWGLSITEDRLKKVAMIHYQGETTTSYPLIFWKKIPDNIRNINDMQEKTVCVEPTSSQDVVLSKYPFINKKSTEKVDDALLNIQYGKADAAFVEPAIANKFKNKYPEIQILDVPLAPEDQVQGVGIVIKRNNSAIIQEVQQAVDELKHAGVIATYEQKWSIS
jgi:ABC-type amino acid transport substrate-binding protein